jgi:hypothetical protein
MNKIKNIIIGTYLFSLLILSIAIDKLQRFNRKRKRLKSMDKKNRPKAKSF